MKKVVTMQDISCVGKCSLTVALPVISAMGIETAVIPTAVLSTHTMFQGFTFHDLTGEILPIMEHWKKEGFRFDAWDEFFDYDKWLDVFARCGIDPAFYANRAFGLDEVLPWDIIDIGVKKEFLLRERAKAYQGKTTPNCKEACSGCGANALGGKLTWCPKYRKKQ
jgi:hypothetical protein